MTEHPAGQHFLERPVEHPGGEAGIELLTECTFELPAPDDPLERRECLPDLVELVLDVRAPRDLVDEQPDEVGIVAPGTQDDLDDETELLPRILGTRLGESNRAEEPPPRLVEDRLEDRILGVEVVIDEAVGDTGLPRNVPDRGRVIALAGEDSDGGFEDQLPLFHGTLAHRRSLRRS